MRLDFEDEECVPLTVNRIAGSLGSAGTNFEAQHDHGHLNQGYI